MHKSTSNAPAALGQLPVEGYVGTHKILELVPITRQTLSRLVRERKFPRPMKLGGTNLWRAQDIRAFIEANGSGEEAGAKG